MKKVFLLQNTANLEASEVISTYVYKAGLEKAQYSFASMVGLFNNVINFVIATETLESLLFSDGKVKDTTSAESIAS